MYQHQQVLKIPKKKDSTCDAKISAIWLHEHYEKKVLLIRMISKKVLIEKKKKKMLTAV